MSRLTFPVLFALVVSISVIGCGSGDNEVIEDTRSQAEIDQELESYEEEMDAADDVTQ
ncbi:hypothetical protein [Roseiconus lacunae]|uniref:Secreted protein n=1 Tax=Roseiconus lacunae TaxID=2605694 RepID=A0ABT7PNH6_9BACT|nr:hypothetical protein [Roseiconus lacunae]MCD0459064.1 hypothetical protein [Roseiconus lacunae]MDM4018067.1 hypothetical protein [Roseiconus lacunae]WRQ50766.1 hypothetical protein U8335_27935 [Stieleria sp. HD01]